jgi:hypothetical protein
MLIFYMSDVVESNSEAAAVTSRTWAKSWRRFIFEGWLMHRFAMTWQFVVKSARTCYLSPTVDGALPRLPDNIMNGMSPVRISTFYWSHNKQALTLEELKEWKQFRNGSDKPIGSYLIGCMQPVICTILPVCAQPIPWEYSQYSCR